MVVALARAAHAQPAPEAPPESPAEVPVEAPPAPAPSPAEVAFAQGRELLDAGKPAEACARFEESIKLDPDAAGTLLNLGLCSQRLGRTATALAWFRKAQFRSAETSMTDYEDVAKNSTFMLAVRVPTLRILVSAKAPTGFTVFLDNKQVADIELGKVEVDPGPHAVELRSPAATPVRVDITLNDGDKRDVTLAPPPPKVVFVDVDRGVARRRLAYIIGGAGLAMWGGSLAVSLVARSDYRSSDHPEDWQDAKHLARYGATSLFVVGAAAIAGAVVLYVKAPGTERVERTALTPVVGHDQLGLVVHGAF